MRIDILSILPQLLESPFSDSIMKRAQDKGCVEIHLHDIRKYSLDKHHKVDDYQYGGGAGMVMSIEPIARLIENNLNKKITVIRKNTKDVRSYRLDSSKLIKIGFKPKYKVIDAIKEIKEAYNSKIINNKNDRVVESKKIKIDPDIKTKIEVLVTNSKIFKSLKCFGNFIVQYNIWKIGNKKLEKKINEHAKNAKNNCHPFKLIIVFERNNWLVIMAAFSTIVVLHSNQKHGQTT